MPSKYGFRTWREKEAEQRQYEEEARRQKEEEEKRKLTAERQREERYLAAARRYDRMVRDVLLDYGRAKFKKVHGVEGPKYLSGNFYGQGDVCEWLLHHEPRRHWQFEAYVPVYVRITFDRDVNPQCFQLEGINGGHDSAELTKEALIETLLGAEPVRWAKGPEPIGGN